MPELRTIPISSHLAETLDEFLRNKSHPVSDLFAEFLADHGSVHPRFDAFNLIDELSFTLHRHREQTYCPPGDFAPTMPR